MSLTKISPPVLVEERTCSGCFEPIIRNLALFDRKRFHFGCLKRSGAQPALQCLECLAYYSSRSQLTRIEFPDGGSSRVCPECGCGDIRSMRERAW